jgi:uncharacterized protein (TIGR02453 family)
MALQPVVRKLSPHFVVDVRPQGGSLSRIYRDTRFSKDKAPYKTNLFAHFFHVDTTDESSAPGFFVRIDPGASLVGGGIWHPATPAANAIRQAVVALPKPWKDATSKGKRGLARMMEGDSLKRVPKGFDPEHPQAIDLKRKDFGLMVPVTDAELTRGDAVEALAAGLQDVAPLVKFLCRATGHAF